MTPYPRFMIAAAHKSSGKTIVSTGLAAAFRAAGVDIATFKKGPDYIDPMWLSAASGTPCYNLDFNAMELEHIRPFFQSRAQGRQLSLVEANKGLFDGVNPDGSDSNAALAKLLGLPVILVIDCQGMTRGIAPLLQGYVNFDRDVNIAGVILNKTAGARHESKLRAAVAEFTDLPVLGAIRNQLGLEIGERHLGLTTPGETTGNAELIAGFGRLIAEALDLAAIRAIAESAPQMAAADILERPAKVWPKDIRLGIARDAAFGFYYPDDLDAFEDAGCDLVPIDMMSDATLPDIDALFIGGGFPETQMEALGANQTMRESVRQAIKDGLPVYAECGGLMYLCRTLRWGDKVAPMVGAIEADAVMHEKPQGRGYVAFYPNPAHLWGAEFMTRKAHEFHYASIEGLPDTTVYARDVQRGHGIDGKHDGIVVHNTVAGFTHLRNTWPSPWVSRWVDFIRRVKATKNPA